MYRKTEIIIIVDRSNIKALLFLIDREIAVNKTKPNKKIDANIIIIDY